MRMCFLSVRESAATKRQCPNHLGVVLCGRIPRHCTLALACLCVCCVAGCSDSADTPDGGPERRTTSGIATVYVVNYPLKYFAERIGGQHVQVVFPAPADQDPAFWKPRPDEIAAFQQADLILLNGASYAKWTKTASLATSRLVDTSASLRERFIKVKDTVTHTHGPSGEHSHAGTAFSTWLDPELAIAQASAIRDALVQLQPQHASTFENNFERLSADLKELDATITKLVVRKKDQPILFSHPVYQYLTRRYHLNAKSVHWEPDLGPSPEQWEHLSKLLEEHAAKWMVWEAAPKSSVVSRLDQLGIQSVVFDPCGNVPEEGDFLEIMHCNAEALRRVYAP